MTDELMRSEGAGLVHEDTIKGSIAIDVAHLDSAEARAECKKD